MRDLLKLLVVGIIFCITPQVLAESYKVVVIPDNIVTENVALDSYIYNASAEFFADDIITILNGTDYINSPSVSEIRASLKNNPSNMLAAKKLTSRFKTSYNVDYVTLKKLASTSNSRYVLLITSYIDAENYILRRTPWDVLNIPGASVIDPAYKISTYAVLVDTEKNSKLWSDTYYKTISVCENRIITRGASPQTEQLQKIKDYSRYITPQIAQNVQLKVLPAELFEKESNQIYYDMGNIDNVFTKKYRHVGKEYDKVYKQRKADYDEFVGDVKEKVNTTVEDTKQFIKDYNEQRKNKALEKQSKETFSETDVKAEPFNHQNLNQNDFNEKPNSKLDFLKNAIFRKNKNIEENDIQSDYDIIEIRNQRKNTLIEYNNDTRPDLRDYYN